MDNVNTKNRFAKARVLKFAALGMIPLVLAVVGYVLYLNGAIVNTAFIIALIAVPLFMAVVLAVLFFVNLNPSVAKTVATSVLILCWILLSAVGFIGQFEFLTSFDGYAATRFSWPLMPPVLSTSNPTDIEYHNYVACVIPFYHSESHVLIYKYDEEQYLLKKAELYGAYVFETHALKSCGEVCEPTDELDGFFLRRLHTGKYSGSHLEYPKRLVLIGTNDETREIMYIAYYDFDLDYLTSLSDFVYENCGWEYIR